MTPNSEPSNSAPLSPQPLSSGPLTAAPALSIMDVLLKPSVFFEALRRLPPSNTRFVWVVLLAGVLTAAYSLLAQKPVQEAMRGIPGMPGLSASIVIGAISTVVVTFIMWLVLWWLGTLGAGAQGRSAEVFSATFLPSVLVSLLLIPLTALFPLHVTVAAPSWTGLEGKELMQAIQTYSQAIQADLSRQPLSWLGKVLSYGAMAWQFYLAWVGFAALTSERSKALRGTLIPLGVFVVLGVAFWLFSRAATGMLGGGA